MQKIDSELLSILIIFFFFLILVFFIVITLAIRYRKRKRENEEMRTRFSEQLLASKVEIQEQTLKNVSHELHDNLGQIASLIKINLSTIQVKNPEAAEAKLANTKELAKQLVMDIKLLSVSLNTDKINKIGLLRAIKVEEEKLLKTGLFEVTLDLPDGLPVIDSEKEIIIYRMIQEILNNTMKHSQAKHIRIGGKIQQNAFILTIADDGVGFDAVQKLADAGDMGNGLTNLQSRAKVINATYTIQSVPGKGTESNISIPI